MPPLALTSLLQSALPKLSPGSRAVVSTLGCCNGQLSPNDVSQWLGYRTRYQLARLLRRDGLPPFEDLAAWTRVLHWLRQAESTCAPLLQLVRRDGLDPAGAYRLVHRVTGSRWSELRRAGLRGVVLRLQDQTRARVWLNDAGRSNGAPGQGTAPSRAPARHVSLEAHGASVSREGAVVRRVPGHPRGVLQARLPMCGCPFDVAITAGGVAWVSRTHAAAVERVELEPLRASGTVHTGAVPCRIAVSPSGTRAYVTNQFAEEIGILDLRECRQTGAIPVSGHPLSVLLSPDGRVLYVTTNLDSLHAVWIATGQIMASVAIPMACTSLALHPSGTRLYVPTWKAGWILELDAHTLRTTREYAIGGVVHEIVPSADGLTLYATNEAGWLDELHVASGRRASLHFDSMPHGLALSPDGAVLYVGLLDGGRVAVIDRRALTPIGSIRTGGKPRRIAFDAAGRCALIVNELGWVDLVR
jgi:YVTN family beta-propeller protein